MYINDFVKSIIKYRAQKSECRKLSFFDYEALSADGFDLPKSFNSVFAYGNIYAVQNITQRKFCLLTDYLEHGVCFYDDTDSVRKMGYANRVGIRRIYTYSTLRKKLIEQYCAEKKINREVIAVGPYIKGADFFMDEAAMERIKKQYGKILLVYPSHSIDNVIAQYEVDSLIAEIEKRKAAFDSVFVCLYWKDVQKKHAAIKQYQDRGYVIVCNGHIADPYFLSRQKDLITLSDCVLTNGLGTHIGYAVCLQKPVYFFRQKIKLTDNNNVSIPTSRAIDETTQVVANAFSEFTMTITNEQREVVRKYWGTW